VAAGLAAGATAAAAGHWPLAPLAAWDTAAVVYLAWTWLTLRAYTPDQTRAHAISEDATRAGSDALLLVASVASLAAVGLLIAGSAHHAGLALALQIGLGVISVVLSWSVVHTIYAIHYAHLYYAKAHGQGIDFGDGPPNYADFAYLAFTIGMTFQVSDTAFRTKVFRVTALRHALLSYLFGTVIVATTINLIAGLSK